jgi:hypothetical protein
MKVFISHSHHDSNLAQSIKQKLLSNNIEVIQVDQNINVGDNLISSIGESIKEADGYIILMTKSYESSKWADLEQILIFDEKFSSKKNKRIYPILFDKSVKLPSLLKNIAYADLTEKDNRERKLEEIINNFSQTIDGKNDINYQKMKRVLREQEELLEIRKLEYKLNTNRQDKLRNSFKWSFLLVSIISVIISIIFIMNKLSNRSFISSELNSQGIVLYFLGFLTAIIPSIYIIIKTKRKNNGE